MGMSIENGLKSNFREFLDSANDDLKKKRYNSAVSNYFKAIVILCDLKIYLDRNALPKNHTERFLFLNVHYKEIEEKLSKIFKKYTDSYNMKMSEEDALNLKKNVEEIRNLLGFKEDI